MHTPKWYPSELVRNLGISTHLFPKKRPVIVIQKYFVPPQERATRRAWWIKEFLMINKHRPRSVLRMFRTTCGTSSWSSSKGGMKKHMAVEHVYNVNLYNSCNLQIFTVDNILYNIYNSWNMAEIYSDLDLVSASEKSRFNKQPEFLRCTFNAISGARSLVLLRNVMLSWVKKRIP